MARQTMGILRVMSGGGDRWVRWNWSRALKGDAEARAAVEEAERIFEAARARGGTAFRVAPGKAAERIESFDPDAEQIVVVPRIAGG